MVVPTNKKNALRFYISSPDHDPPNCCCFGLAPRPARCYLGGPGVVSVYGCMLMMVYWDDDLLEDLMGSPSWRN